MKRHKFTKWNKEKISIYASAALVVAVCVVSGMYAQSQSPSRKQIIDIESVGDQEMANAEEEINATLPDIGNVQPTVEDTVPVTVNTQRPIPIPSEAAKGMERAALDLTGDAEIMEPEVESVEFAEAEEISIPTMAEGNSQETVLHFNVDDGISWPVIGNVIMNYSMDERTYFATLNQYCYYPAVAISSQVEAPVSAAALGNVVKVGINEEIGQYVIMDLGDGYQATYGQLKDLTVETGDKVSRGQIIGYVAEPTKYYSLEGTNVYFKLEKDGEPINPLTYFR